MKELAILFYDQCIGSYSGHMSNVPNCPLMLSIFSAAGFSHGTKKDFADILRNFADELYKDEEF